jgi:hypothetical protein
MLIFVAVVKKKEGSWLENKINRDVVVTVQVVVVVFQLES